MMKTIIALLLASFASAFKPSKAFLVIGGLASAAKYDPKIFSYVAYQVEQCRDECDKYLFPSSDAGLNCKDGCKQGIPASSQWPLPLQSL